MEMMYQFILLILAASFAVSTSSTALKRVHNEQFEGPLSNMVYYNNSLYIGGKNMIYVLGMDLNTSMSVKTCNSSDCRNVNKLLLIDSNKDRLVTCGTIGRCDVYLATTLKNITRIQELEVSTDIDRPVQAMITDSMGKGERELLIAVTFGKEIETIKPEGSDFYTYNYAFSKRKFENIPDLNDKEILRLQIYEKSFEDYVIQYKGSFQNNGFSYFITVQKEYVGSNKSISKLVRLCQNDTDFRSYADIFIQCKDKAGTTYDIVQNVIITSTKVGSSDQMFIGAFSKAENSNDWVICSVGLNELDKQIMSAKKQYALSKPENENKRRYLPDLRKTYVENETKYVERDLTCDTAIPSYIYVIGNITKNLTAGYINEQNRGIPTALHAAFQDDNLVIIVGTSKGQLMLMNYDGMELDEYSVTNVSSRGNIKAIYTKNDDVYVLSDKKVHLYSSTNCSEFKTCQKTVSGRNPLCGWCVLQQRATRKSVCTSQDKQNHWLSSLDRCARLELSDKGISVNTEKQLSIKASKIPGHKEDYKYECLFKNKEVLGMTTATRVGNDFNCSAPIVTSHTEGILQLVISNLSPKVVIAEAPFLFYECSTYQTCKECVSTSGSKCTWSLDKPECVQEPSEGAKPENNDKCPHLLDNTNKNFIPSGTESPVEIKGANLPNQTSYWCIVNDGVHFDIPATVQGDKITCDMRLDSQKSKKSVPVYIMYGMSKEDRKHLDDDFTLSVTVYNCRHLADDCSHCKVLNSRYNCKWCADGCQHNGCDDKCPAPTITMINPDDGPLGGKTVITITGKNLGSKITEVGKVMIGESECAVNSDITFPENDDFEVNVPDRIECNTDKQIPASNLNQELPVNITVNGLGSNTNVTYTFKKPKITSIHPSSGPKAGGTNITILGTNLAIGNRNWKVLLDSSICGFSNVFKGANGGPDEINCVTNSFNEVGNKKATLSMDEAAFSELNASFEAVSNPNISGIEGIKGGFLSGGTTLTVVGTDMHHANDGEVILDYDGEVVKEKCVIESGKVTKCLVPRAPASLKDDLMAKLNKSTNRHKRAACEDCIEVTITVKLDGVKKDIVIKYVQNPSFEKFGGDGSVLLYDTDEHQIILKGDALTLVTTKDDFKVTVGIENCTKIFVTKNELTCSPPKEQPKPVKSEYPEVEVQVGNIKVPVGYLLYKEKIELYAIIAGAAAGAVLFILVIVIVIVIIKYRKVGKKAKAYEKSLADMEMEIKTVARQEFLDMHTTMSTVNKNLVEQGFPYHSYQQFSCNVMFSVDYLWTEPVMTDDERLKANRGMESLESLIYNKFFLVSVITTMEKEKRFFIREKSNLAGNLCAVLMGRMDYLDEILKLLMNNLVQDTQAKKHKALFRRCESITEKLLSNWLSLCLYPHLKSHSGSPLYLLYMATQKTMESGPIDAVTGEARCTLSEEKLLKKWSSSTEESNDKDLKFEAKTLTLNVVVDNGEEIFKCKVLDCDTISQVKNKCLNQIYVNYPASQLPVGANDLELEWHEGFGGTLKLRDEDNTSKRDGKWLRLNTLAHYNVKDGSNMALIDPHSADADNQEDYVNLANINMEGVCDGSIDSSQPLTLHEEENAHVSEPWHLVKKEEESSKQSKSVLADLYLNRLFTTKQSLMEYMRPLFDIVLDHDKCPPPTKFLYDYLDELGDKYKVDSETVHAWKSHSYAIRVWATLMKMPNLLFDVSIPAFMDDTLEVISQVFIESFSLATQKFTKDTPPEKLIFHHEKNHYRDRVKEFYKNVKVDPEDSDGFRQYMADVNRLQQGTDFNKVSALYRLYKQLKPYFEDIIESLATNKEASNLQLDRKLEQVIAIMEEDD